jgi:hypothetical protein
MAGAMWRRAPAPPYPKLFSGYGHLERQRFRFNYKGFEARSNLLEMRTNRMGLGS